MRGHWGVAQKAFHDDIRGVLDLASYEALEISWHYENGMGLILGVAYNMVQHDARIQHLKI